jgi:hypothetical protein
MEMVLCRWDDDHEVDAAVSAVDEVLDEICGLWMFSMVDE